MTCLLPWALGDKEGFGVAGFVVEHHAPNGEVPVHMSREVDHTILQLSRLLGNCAEDGVVYVGRILQVGRGVALVRTAVAAIVAVDVAAAASSSSSSVVVVVAAVVAAVVV